MKKYPKVGKRIIKTSIAVLLSINIYVLFLLLDKLVGIDRSEWRAPSNMYTPFFAGIAAVYATHRDKESSFKQAKIRSFGSIIGGYFGMVITLISEFVLISCWNLKESNYIMFCLIHYTFISLGIIPLITTTIYLKQGAATFITCLTYLSVTISIRNGGMPVPQFATNRVFSTLVGVGISLLVNNFMLLRRRNKDILFVSSLDNNFLDNEINITPYLKYKLNNLYYNKMPLAFMTTRTLSSLEYAFDEVDVNYPMIIMNGSAIYHFDTKKYDEVYNINLSIRKQIDEILEQINVNAFKYSINDNCLHCYHDKLNNDGEKNYYTVRVNKGNDDFVRAKLPDDVHSSLYVIIDKKDKIDEAIERISKIPNSNEIDLIEYEYDEGVEGYWYLKINCHSANKSNLVNKLKKDYGFKKVIACGSGKTDVDVIKNSDLSMCLSKAKNLIKNSVDIVIDDAPETVLRIFDKIYYSKNPSKCIEKIKNKYNR